MLLLLLRLLLPSPSQRAAQLSSAHISQAPPLPAHACCLAQSVWPQAAEDDCHQLICEQPLNGCQILLQIVAAAAAASIEPAGVHARTVGLCWRYHKTAWHVHMLFRCVSCAQLYYMHATVLWPTTGGLLPADTLAVLLPSSITANAPR